MKRHLFFLLVIVVFNLNAQKSAINDYKYVIIPKKFDWLKEADQYQTSSLTKFLFEKRMGFKALLSDETFPQDLAKNNCLGLKVEVKNKSGLIYTKNVIQLLDCNNNIIFTSLEGRSKAKQYKKAYHESIRGAFESIKALNYKYNGKKFSLEEKQETNPIKNTTIKKVNKPIKPVKINGENMLYAQEIENGFQLVNTKPEIVFEILKSSKKGYYFLKNKTGILFKKDGKWIAEFYENGKLVQKKYQIKF